MNLQNSRNTRSKRKKFLLFGNHIKMILFSTVIIILIAVTINSFINHVQMNENKIADNNLLVASNNGATIIKSKFDHYMSILKTTAKVLENYENLQSQEVMEALKNAADVNSFDELSLVFLNGKTYTSNGENFTNNSSNYLNQIINRGTFISNVTQTVNDEYPKVNFYVPVYKGHQHVASLRLSMETIQLAEAIDLTLFDSEGYYHLVDENGRYVAVGNSDNALLMDQNFFDAIGLLEYKKYFSKEQIMDSFLEGLSGYSKYRIGSEERYAYCEPVGVNNWVLMTIVPKEIITQLEQQTIYYAFKMAMQLSVLLILVFIGIYIQQRNSNKTAVLNDKCFRILAEQSGKVILEWDFINDIITPNSGFQNLFDIKGKSEFTWKAALDSDYFHPEDRDSIKQLFNATKRGDSYDEVKIRLLHKSGEYHYCSISSVTIMNEKNKPFKAISTLEDIDDKIKLEAELRQKSERDQLTCVYNKLTTEFLIKKALKDLEDKELKSCALMIMDIDNFKKVNDNYGHQYGDSVLNGFAKVLISLTSEDDIVGRIGGDEFFVFLKGFDSVELVKEKALSIGRLLKDISVCNQDFCGISASIGISIYPDDGVEFDDLYKYADLALYHTKENGKDGYTIYDKEKVSGHDFVGKRTEIDKR